MAINQVAVADILHYDTDEPFLLDKEPSARDGDFVTYQTSQKAVRYFCKSCSAHLFFQYLGESGTEEGFICVSTGALEKIDGVIEPGYHQWVEDTLDGGMADFFRALGGSQLPRYSRGKGSPTLPIGWKAEGLKTQAQRDILTFSCHCKSVQFGITRPNEESALPYSGYPDFLYAHDTTHLSRTRNSEDSKWWLRPLNSSQPTKYLVGYCSCAYCRRASGSEFQSWAYIPLANIVDLDGNRIKMAKDKRDELANVREAVDKLGLQDTIQIPSPPNDNDHGMKRLPGLKQYISSPGCYREACAKCGATVCAWKEGRSDLICIAPALVDEDQDGSRAEGWLEWHLDRVGFTRNALSKTNVVALTEGLRAVKAERDGPTKGQSLSTAAASTHVQAKQSEPASSLRADQIKVEA